MTHFTIASRHTYAPSQPRTRPYTPGPPRPQISDARPGSLAFFGPAVLALALLALLFTPTGASRPAIETHVAPAFPNAQNLLAGLPSRFEPNVGQAGEGIAFTLNAKGYLASLSANAVHFALPEGKAPENRQEPAELPKADQAPARRSTLTMSFVGANPNPEIKALDPQEGISNYFLGNDPKNWRTDVPGYSKIYYEDLYDGIDMVIYDDLGQVRYDFVVAPGADPNQIEIAFEGAENLKLSDTGDLVVSSPYGDLSHEAPYSYQGKTEIESSFEIRGGRAGFRLGAYDKTQELTIDPSLAYSSYQGGTNNDSGERITVDATGAAYVAGNAISTDFPTVAPYQASRNGLMDAIVTKVAPGGGSVIYATYLGGGGLDMSGGIAVDSSGAVYLTGNTDSSDFPTASPLQGTFGGTLDAFVTKLAANGGSLTYSSYLGGSLSEEGHDIKVDSLGAAHLVGQTQSTNFPTAAAYQGTNAGGWEAFFAKVAPSGASLTYSSYLGGSGTDSGYGIAIDASGALYLVGYTYSAGFPTAGSPFQLTYAGAGNSDCFITKVASGGGSLAYSGFLGGTGFDSCGDIDIDPTGAAYVTGGTEATDFPVAGSPYQPSKLGFSDAIVTKFTPDGSSLAYSTHLGGSSDEFASGIAVDASGAAYVVGKTDSFANFPTVGAFDSSFGGGTWDGFITKLSPSGQSLGYSSYLGGTAQDLAYGVALDSSGAAFVTGSTQSSNFPTAFPFQGTNGGSADVFITKVNPSVSRLNTTLDATESAGPANRPDVSNLGSRVAFHSPAGDLVAGDSNGVGDVFVKGPITGTIERVSVATDGTQSNGGSIVASMSPDSRYVAYFSQATNLVAGDTNGVGDVVLRDRAAGTTERVSIADDESQANGASRYPQVTPDGRYVVFQSEASNLVAGDSNGKWDIFLRDRTLGTTERVSVADDESQSDKASARPSISDDGNLITFHSWATNLVASDTNGLSDVFVRNRSGATTTRASVATDGTQGNGESQFPKISGNGAAVVFHSTASNLVAGDTNGARDTFVRTIGGATTFRVSVSNTGTEADNISGYADISTDARYVAFHSAATNLVTGDTNAIQDVFVRDRVGSTTRLVSTTGSGGASNGVSGMSAISAEGTHVAYQSQASNLVPGDTNSAQDVFHTTRP